MISVIYYRGTFKYTFKANKWMRGVYVMQYGLTFPSIEARVLAELAHEAEEAGWDGIFVWDLVWGTDAWVSLAAVAMRTERVRFGTMLTPLSRRRPWKVASEVVTLDHLSNGRVILP